jgi:signal peptidase I
MIQRYNRYIETLPNGRRHDIIEVSDDGPFDNTGVYTVPSGHYFALGDNRDGSRDSRFLSEVGFLPRVNLIGRAEFIFFSIDGSALKIWTWPWTVRFGRVLTAIR